MNSFSPIEVESSSTLSSSLNSVANEATSIIQLIGYAFMLLLFVLAIIFLIKAINDRKRLNNEVCEQAINSVKTTSLILLIVNIILCNSLSLITIILSIISLITIGKAKKLFLEDLEQAKSKASLSSTLNIVAAALMLLAPIGIVIMTTILATISNLSSMM
ncbi:MAG: hypothetical protein J6M02_06290 [Clostridia bacterium]|nr:hypothetical protein [Clostridia bacterium]